MINERQKYPDNKKQYDANYNRIHGSGTGVTGVKVSSPDRSSPDRKPQKGTNDVR